MPTDCHLIETEKLTSAFLQPFQNGGCDAVYIGRDSLDRLAVRRRGHLYHRCIRASAARGCARALRRWFAERPRNRCLDRDGLIPVPRPPVLRLPLFVRDAAIMRVSR